MKEKIENWGLIHRITGWRICRWAASHPLLGRFCNYEVISYIVCGVATTIVSYVCYFLAKHATNSVLASQIISWVIAVGFAYVVNKVFVFLSADWSAAALKKEIIPFFSCRIFSLVVETLFMELTVNVLLWNEPLMKLVANVFVLIINYIGSKLLVFRKR